MFPFSLRASLATFIASAVTVSAAPSLSVRISTPNVNVDGLENLKVTTTIINTGNESLKLLNDPRGVLDPFPENTFIITNTAGPRRPWFNGAVVNYSPKYAAGLDDPSIFTVLAPGASVNITHDLSAAYNFTLSGPGNYSIKPSNLFTYVGVNGTPEDLYAAVEDIAEVRLSGNHVVSRVLDRRAGDVQHCSMDQRLQISAAVIQAYLMARDAVKFINTINYFNPPPRWITWFGQFNACKRIYVRRVYELMISFGFAHFNYDCSCGRADVFAFAKYDWIIICIGFWDTPTTGLDSKAGTLIQVASNFPDIGDTRDFAIGEDACRALAVQGDLSACLWNADSYRYFAEDPDNPNNHNNHNNSVREQANPL